ncbi:hypothetical protein SUGI_1017980 [Cryptomeria japonica]|nr:hypothetical protein SUGI_1017980 [Cryptomeria japonica]
MKTLKAFNKELVAVTGNGKVNRSLIIYIPGDIGGQLRKIFLFSGNGDPGKQNTRRQGDSFKSSISDKFIHLRNLEEGFVKPTPRVKPNTNNDKGKGNKDNWRSGGIYARPRVSVEEDKNPKTVPPPKPSTVKLNKNMNPNSEMMNVLEINDSLVERIQQSCKTFGVFARWCGLGIPIEAIADWFKSSFDWIISIAILSEGFLYIDYGNARHKNEFLTDLDSASKLVLEVFPSQINPRAIPKLDIYFNLERGGFVIKENPLPTRQFDGVEKGEIIGDQSMDEEKNPSLLLTHEDMSKDKQGRVSDSKAVKN